MSFARVRAFVVIGVLAVAAVVFVVVALVRDSQGGAAADGGCPAGSVMAELSIPPPDQITVRILNGTTTAGLAEKVTTDFKNRRFTVQKPAEAKKKLDGIATITFGPRAVGPAQLVKAFFLDDAKVDYNPKRTNKVIDIVIGSRYQQLATTTEVNQSLIELGEPKLPAGACAAPKAEAAGD